MIQTFKVLIIFFYVIPIFGQLDKQQFIDNYEPLQSIKKYESNFQLKILDKRVYKNHEISLERFKIYLFEFLKTVNVSNDISEVKSINNREAFIEINFFNLIESSSKKTTLKGIAEISLKGNDCSDLNEQFNVNDEYVTQLKFKNITNDKHVGELVEKMNDFSRSFAKKISDCIEELKKKELKYIFKISSIGIAKIKNSKEEAKKEAILDALIKSGELAFGINVMNKSEIIDYGDVTDLIKSESGGKVLDYFLNENNIVYTTDGFCCVLVNSLMKEKLNN